MRKEKIVEAELIDEEEYEEKPFFFPRLLAYVIDFFVITFAATLVLMAVPANDKYDKYMKEYEKIQTDFLENKISSNEYIEKSKDVVYELDRTNIPALLVQLPLYIGYFMVFQYFNKGQTLGKKIMKLKVVSTKRNELEDSKLTINQIAVRTLIIDTIATNLLILGSVLFIGKNYYFYVSTGIQVVTALIVIATLICVLIRKDGRGLHDLVSYTKVVNVK